MLAGRSSHLAVVEAQGWRADLRERLLEPVLIDVGAAALLGPMAETIDGGPVLHRYALVLHLLQRPALDEGAQPPFEPSDVFPRADLSAACGLWAVTSCAAFLDAFYGSLGFPDRLDAYRKRI